MKNVSRSVYLGFGVGLVASLILIVGAVVGAVLFNPTVSPSAQAAGLVAEQAQTPSNKVDGEALVAAYEQALIGVYQDSLPSIVNIRVTKRVDVSDLGRFGFGLPGPDDDQSPQDEPEAGPDGDNDSEDIPEFFDQQGGGSGFVWDDEGHIVTNDHVVSGATSIEVIFADDTTAEAELVGSDPDSDLAVIKVDLPATQLTPLKLGDSDALQVGQLAIALGNPFGQDFTMTSGIISGVGRTIRGGNSGFSIPEVIQTDAPINPGNSGGPLLNRQGEVLGINSQIISQSGGSSGIGFAVPINTAKRVVPKLIAGETFEYAWLGIQGGTVTREVADFRNVEAGGVLVIEATEDGPAAKAGLDGRDESLNPSDEAFQFGGEIIKAIDGQPLKDMEDLITYLLKETEPGDTVTLDVIESDGQTAQVEVTLGVRPGAGTLDAEE